MVVGNARVRALHTSPDAPAVDIYVDGSLGIAGLSFGEFSDYVELSAGMHNVQVKPAGSGPTGPSVIDADIELTGGQDYTVAATGMLANIQPVVLLDSTAAPGPNMAKVRVFHASPDAPAVDIGIPAGPTLFEDVSFTEITPFEAVDAGTVDLEVRPSGTIQPVLSIPSVSLVGGSLYTFVALGLLEGTPSLRVMPIVDVARVRMPM
jgi:hypothetical protein